ncbi:MAG: hypothetical protein HDS48_01465 [Bacteroides sp.]|nr:hypothetical protein [Bacteroides sp.]
MEENEGQEIVSNLTHLQKQIKLELAKLAAKEKTISYSELCSKIPLPYSMDNPYHRNLLSEDLGAISEEEVDMYEWPMLSSVVIERGKGMPSRGFFTWAEELYPIKLRKEEDRMVFFVEEFKRCVMLWSSAEGLVEIENLENELKK